MYDEYGFYIEDEVPGENHAASDTEAPTESPEEAVPHLPIREHFPEAGAAHLGGTSDGWEYRTVFGGAKLAYTYEMVKQFLREEGYGDVPLPATAEELRLFRRPRQAQLDLFGEHGYVHNPVKILFPRDSKQRNTLILCLYNESLPRHLLRFHGVI